MTEPRDPDETGAYSPVDDDPGWQPATGTTERAVTRSRRRFARRQWARRWLAWKPVVAVVVVLVLLVGGLWLVYLSSVLSVKGVDVQGTQRLSAGQIRQAAAVTDGQPLARVDLGRIRSRVEALAGVRSADVSREWPDHVLIDVRERQAVAVVEMGGSLHGMDEDGVVFRDYASAPPGLPLIQTSAQTDSDALREGALVVAALPSDLAAKVDHVDIGTVDDISLVLHDGREVEWGSSDQSEEKAEVLAVLLKQPGTKFDVSVPGQPTARP